MPRQAQKFIKTIPHTLILSEEILDTFIKTIL